MANILIRHLSGVRVLQVDEFAVDRVFELIVGRDPAADIRLDPDQDEMVSRQHAKIARDPMDGTQFQVIDLQSRNGTFLNRERVSGAARLYHNDVVQLGPGGPEFRFEMDPPPPGASHRPLPWTSPGEPMVRPTTETWTGPDAQPAPRPVGRATVERMLGDAFGRVRRESSKSLWIGAIALVATIAVGVFIWLTVQRYQREQAAAQQRNQLRFDQLSEELKKNPRATESMRQEIARLEGELRKSNQQNEATLRTLVRAVSEQRMRAVADRSAQQRTEDRRPTPAADSQAFDTLMAQANKLIGESRGEEALVVAKQMIELDANRWEGFALAGLSARMTRKLELASSLLQTAIEKAPPDKRGPFEQYLKEVQQELGR